MDNKDQPNIDNNEELKKAFSAFYKELFYVADKVDQIFQNQQELGQLLVNLIQEQKKKK